MEQSSFQLAHTAAQALKSHAPDLSVRVCGAWVWISGPTYQHRTLLRFAGCRWSANKEQWYAPFAPAKSRRGGTSYQQIVETYGEREVQS